ncbi:AtpZ/AtpI family protein [Candidatus Gottesmanbacteria bacterium]|nr:AtpZ/AtpI family protein [Candidatus Gottesmanbacteria bacterium]
MKTRKILHLGRGSEDVRLIEEEAPQRKEEESRSRMLQVLSIASELGFAISLPIAGGAFLGRFLDTKFNSTPRMTLSLIFVGVFLGGANIYFIIKETRQK